MKQFAQKLGLNLRKARRSLGYTQRGVTRKTGVSQSLLSAIESGNRDIKPEMLCTLCRLYGTDIGKVWPKEKIKNLKNTLDNL